MAVTQKFINAVEQSNVRLVRIMISDSIVVDPTFKEFDEKLSAAKNMSGLYDVHDGEEFETQSTEWTNAYENEQMRKVITNFSKERLELLQKICTHIRGEMATKIESERKKQTTHTETIDDATMQKNIGLGLAVIGGIFTITGAIVVQKVLIGVGIITAIAGTVMYIKNKDK